ncbi:MAG: hypothetical protein FH758_04465 [Firmicutes bacterium]|nr:hypothetical protein [Bacillota bacterium]
MTRKKSSPKYCAKACTENDVKQVNTFNISQNQSINQQNSCTQGDTCAVSCDGIAIAPQFCRDANFNIQVAAVSASNESTTNLIQNHHIALESYYPGDCLAALIKPLDLKMDKDMGDITLNGNKINAHDLGKEIISYLKS